MLAAADLGTFGDVISARSLASVGSGQVGSGRRTVRASC